MVEPTNDNGSQGSYDAWEDYDFSEEAPGLNRFQSAAEG